MKSYYSPLRYPGGKGKISFYFSKIVEENVLTDGHYAEPYAGGAGIALSLLINGLVKHVHLNDLNYPLYCFWNSVINETDSLCSKIVNSRITVNAWRRHKNIIENSQSHNMLDVGYALLFLNRTNRSGIINGSMIGGYEQSGTWKIDARFYKETLIKRIQEIANHKNRISIYNMDALDFIKNSACRLPQKTLIYIDPPYYKKGQRLYDNHYAHEDHKKIANAVSKIKKHWIVSYDNVSSISELYAQHRQLEYSLKYSAGTHYDGSELMIYSDKLLLPSPNNPLVKKVA